MNTKQIKGIIGVAVNAGYTPIFFKLACDNPLMFGELQLAEVYFIEKWLMEEKGYMVHVGIYGGNTEDGAECPIQYHAEDITSNGNQHEYSSSVMFNTFDGARFHGIDLILIKLVTGEFPKETEK